MNRSCRFDWRWKSIHFDDNEQLWLTHRDTHLPKQQQQQQQHTCHLIWYLQKVIVNFKKTHKRRIQCNVDLFFLLYLRVHTHIAHKPQKGQPFEVIFSSFLSNKKHTNTNTNNMNGIFNGIRQDVNFAELNFMYGNTLTQSLTHSHTHRRSPQK